jgi:hypothetical protein
MNNIFHLVGILLEDFGFAFNYKMFSELLLENVDRRNE